MKNIKAHIGQKWFARDGRIRIVVKYNPRTAWPVVTTDADGGGRLTHTFDGGVWGAPIETKDDLITEVPE